MQLRRLGRLATAVTSEQHPSVGYGLLVVCIAWVLGLSQVADSDVWWHIANGEWLLQHGRFPGVDPFSHTAGARADVPVYWGFELFAALATRCVGIESLPLVQAALIASIFGLLFLAGGWLGISAPARAIGLIAVLPIVRFHLVLRPHLLAFVLLAVLFVLLALYSRQRRIGLLVLCVAVLWLWRQIHPSFPLGVGVLGLFLLSPRILRTAGPQGAASLRPLPGGSARAGLILGSMATFVLPPLGLEGTAWIHDTMRLLGSRGGLVLEWTPPMAFPGLFTLYWLYTAVGLAGLLLSREARTPFVVGLYVVGCLASLSAVRHVCTFVFLTVLPVTAAWADVLARLARRRHGGAVLRRGAALGAVLASTLLALRAGLLDVYPPFGLGVVRNTFPAGAAEFLEAHELPGRMYNTHWVGGYLLWRLGPAGKKIFWDGRLLLYEDVFERLEAAARSGEPAEQYERLLEELGVGHAVIGYRDEHPLARHILGHPDWALLYWDDSAMVLARRDRRIRPLLARQWHWVRPWDRTLSFLEGPEADRARVRGELVRKLNEDPGCSRAAAMLGTLSLHEAQPEKAVALLRGFLRRERDSDWVRLVLGQALLMAGRSGEAIEVLDPLRGRRSTRRASEELLREARKAGKP